MSTREFLSNLDLDQLRFARDEADRRIKKIEDEAKVSLWIVEGTCTNDSCFYEHQFQQAKKRLAQLILSEEFAESDVALDHPRIVRLRVYESEVAEYMELND